MVATNNGPNGSTGVIITNVLEDGYTYVSSSTSSGTYSSSTNIWTIGTLNNGATDSLTITATVTSIGNNRNTATIEGNETDENIDNNISWAETVPMDFFVPEGFSPNGDGINDELIIRGIFFFPENSIVIYNRWGNKVYEADPYINKWDGRSIRGLKVGGDELPVGTYFYLLNLGDGSEVIKGTFYLNR
jgi:gliding motility-associated-like protein